MSKSKIIRIISLFAFSFLILGNIFAHGANDIEEKEAKTMESWQETFDLNGKKAGKYNIMITASDLGGNTRIEGPHNIYLDPKSDLPICGITNPHENMRVVGNLNVVGTCIDDDSVQYVDLIIDGDEANPVRAWGQEYWSYYLDTTDFEEGVHTIKAIGTDINGLQSAPVTVTWNLDRRQPITALHSHELGQLVSGKVHFNGVVDDGNGIKKLAYSIDNGKIFHNIKFADNGKNVTTNRPFSIFVDTTKMEDGPAVLWIKAYDNAGSIGIFSFLYFIDNTKPDVKIITPLEKENQYGKFLVAGSVKDALEITSLKWEFGLDTGEFEIVPGNPYWGIVFNTIGSIDKSRKFSITATDRAGNSTTVSRLIPLNQELDKPIVEIEFPKDTTFIESEDKCFVRGIAKDKEGIASVKYNLDGGEWIAEETKGVFCGDLVSGADLTPGPHTVTVVATDKNGVEGNPFTVTFNARGALPSFTGAKVGTEDFYDGISVHPEAGSSFTVTAGSGIGLESVTAKIRWGEEGEKSFDFTPNGATTFPISIPFGPDSPKGVVKIYLTATDKGGRVKNFKGIVDVVNTSVITSNAPAVVFDDSCVGEDGVIVSNPDFPVTGYFVGGIAKSVSIEPKTPFATAELNGNVITLIPGTAYGSSEQVVVRVTTEQDLTFDSRPLTFKCDTVFPVLTVEKVLIGEDEQDVSRAINGREGEVTISGTVECESGLGKLGYRTFVSRPAILNGAITSMEPFSKSEITELPLEKTFSIPFDVTQKGEGLFIIEIIAESLGGNKVSSALCVSNIPDLGTLPNGKTASAKNPMIVWADGEDVYFAAAYQGGALDNDFGIFHRSEMKAGTNPLTQMVLCSSTNKKASSKFSAEKAPTLHAYISSIGGEKYASGMPVTIAKGQSSTLTAYIETQALLTTLSYSIKGETTPGGADSMGSVKVTKALDKADCWVAEIPLSNLPVRVNKITIPVKVGNFTYDLVGSFEVVRPLDAANTDDNLSVYTLECSDSYFDEDSSSYIMVAGGTFNFYANVPEVVEATLLTSVEGLSIEQKGNNITLTVSKDGSFKDVQIRVKDVNGVTYNSPLVNFLVDSGAPEVVISTPEKHLWVRNDVKISGTIVDPFGVKGGEYSLDGGQTWTPLSVSTTRNAEGATFTATADLSSATDGIIGVDVRVFDNAGNTAYAHTVCHRDTTPPTFEVVMPTSEDTVNGDNLIGFKVYDEGALSKSVYISPPAEKGAPTRTELETDNFVMLHVGTNDKPIDEAMGFEFIDESGNVAKIEAWEFMIDKQSDLPVSEIHIPIEDEVITRDFTISGVVYDDDGPCEVYYKIDNDAYKLVTLPEGKPIVTYDENGNVLSSVPDYKRSSFAIPIEFSTLRDNEHIISVYAVDTNGVKGEPVERKFRVSTEEPKGTIESPDINTSVRGEVTVSGYASDRNGIEKVLISFDNGNSFNNTIGQETWSYTFDTRAIPNGTNVVFIKVFDKYGVEGLYSSIINIDNKPPEMILESPVDYSVSAGPVSFRGYAFDDVAVTEMYVTVCSLDGKTVTDDMKRIDFPVDRVISQQIELSGLENGSYNVELTALDKAGNATHISRNVTLNKSKPLATIKMLYPLNGEQKQGYFNIYGEITSDKPVEMIALYIDDKFASDGYLLPSGYFRFSLGPEEISDGMHEYRVDARVEGGRIVRSRVQTLEYKAVGPWVKIDNFVYGDFAIDRPYIQGAAGYQSDAEILIASKLKGAPKELKEEVENQKVQKVEISFDNGKTFAQVSKAEKWMYRVENKDMAEGYHYMLVRATMRNGETAIERVVIQIDNTAPMIRLIAPEMGGRYNQELLFSGLSSDEIGLKEVKIALRKGDKASYEVPSFIQGLYLDWKFWGATLFDIGAGLTFFDDNVKLQFCWGQMTKAQFNIFQLGEYRYGGDSILGLKIIANVAQIPFSYFFGRDLEWLSASVAVGAHFAMFNMSDVENRDSQILSALIAQVEFPRVKFPKMKMFSTFSLYTEFSLWFIPSDVGNSGTQKIETMRPQWSEGIRINIF